MTLPISLQDVRAAADRLAGVAHKTPVITSRLADERSGARVYFKCENLQRVGAFKFRGAYNALAQFDAQQRRAGVIAFSSGNHAQAIALHRPSWPPRARTSRAGATARWCSTTATRRTARRSVGASPTNAA
jgi:threonine dehydratase